jgi:invasion protein IalB
MTRFAIAAAGATLMAMSAGVSAQESTAPEPAAWGTSCASAGRAAELQCSIEQRVVLSNNGALLTLINIRPVPGQAEPVMLVQLPVGLYLPAQLKFGVDGKALDTQPFQTCDGQGCYVGAPVKAELLAAMKAGNALELTFQDQSRTDITVPVALNGFSAALAQAE